MDETTSVDPPVFIHDKGLCESSDIGAGTRIWAFAHILPGARLGRNCNVCDGVFIENDVVVGDNTTIKCGVQLWDGTRVGSGVFIGPNATFTNDRSPIANVLRAEDLVTHIEDDVSVGANATILPGVRIGRAALIGAGAVVTHNVPPFAIVVGNPAVVEGYRETEQSRARLAPAKKAVVADRLATAVGARQELEVGDCFLERMPSFVDMRGSLLPLENGKGLPFQPVRIFSVFGVANRQVRGEHAHRVCRQFLVALTGGVSVVLDDGARRSEVRLDDPTVGLYLAPMVWGTQYKFDPGSILIVIASHPYDPLDYIRDYEEFRGLVR